MAKENDLWVQDGVRLKVWYFMREDLGMTKGKFGVQIGHGTDFVHMSAAENPHYADWLKADVGNRRKVVLRAKDLAAVEKMVEACRAHGMLASLIGDAGLTEFSGPTISGMVVAPHPDSDIPTALRRARTWKDEDDLVDQKVS